VTGLAWWTKYNGWLAIAITVSGGTAWTVFSSTGRKRWKRTLLVFFAMVLAAVVTWFPVLYDLQQYGGYAAVAENHSKYVGGFAKWLESFQQQMSFHRAVDGWPSALGLVLAVSAVHVLGLIRSSDEERDSPAPKGHSYDTWIDHTKVLGVAMVLCVACCVAGSSVVLFSLSICILDPLVRKTRLAGEATRDGALPLWIVIAWMAGLSLATPLYHPYPRLTLPWLVALWFATGFVIVEISQLIGTGTEHDAGNEGFRNSIRAASFFVPMAVFCGSVFLFFGPTSFDLNLDEWQRRDGLKSVAERILAATGSPSSNAVLNGQSVNRVFYVFAEPALFYYLNALQPPNAVRCVVLPVADLGFAARDDRGEVAVYLLAGPHAQTTQTFIDQMRTFRHRFESVATFQYDSSDLVLSNQFQVDQWEARRTQSIEVYRLK
jgi:hypothetical protein